MTDTPLEIELLGSVKIRPARAEDEAQLLQLRQALWPETSSAEHLSDVRGLLSGKPRSTLPLVIYVAESRGALLGFVEVGLRSHADGCDPSRPCGFVEGWYVRPKDEGRGIGRALIARSEQWARDQGCTELASDTWADNEASIEAHKALAFEVVDTCVNFRKRLS